MNKLRTTDAMVEAARVVIRDVFSDWCERDCVVPRDRHCHCLIMARVVLGAAFAQEQHDNKS